MTIIGLSFILAAIAADPQPQPELLPPTPADWQIGRIDFPLSFAPELEYKGFEELRFAPGMFKPDSDTYFTCIFAMKITDDVALDATVLQSMLETYYRRLYRAVAKDKLFEIDVSKISAQVRTAQPDAQPNQYFSATIASFDPFVTGKPLTLNLEIIVIVASQTDHRIFAAVSPKPADSPVWIHLRSLKDQFQERSVKDPKQLGPLTAP